MTRLKISKNSFCFVLIFLFLTQSAMAFIPSDFPNVEHIPETLKALPVSKARLGVLDIPFEKISLYNIPKKIGAGKILHRGDGGDSDYYLCYRSSATKPQYILVSSNVMGGTPLYVQNIYLADHLGASDLKAVDQCPVLPEKYSPVKLGNGLKLGDSISKVKELMGTPSQVDGAWSHYAYLGKAPHLYDSEGNQYDESGLLSVKIVNGKVVALFAAKSTTD